MDVLTVFVLFFGGPSLIAVGFWSGWRLARGQPVLPVFKSDDEPFVEGRMKQRVHPYSERDQ